MKLIYIAEWIGPVFQSQVIELLNNLYTHNDIESITLLVAIRSETDSSFVDTLNPDIKVLFFKSVPLYPVVDMIMTSSLMNELKKLEITSDTVFHTRGEYMGILFSKAFKKLHTYEPKLLVDVRGVVIKEVTYYMKDNFINKIKLNYLKNMYKKFLTSKYTYSAVTEELKQYLMHQYKVSDTKIDVNHCIAGHNFDFDTEIRKQIREDLSIAKDEILFVFSTSSDGGKWQNSDEIALSLVTQGHRVLMLSKKQYDNDAIISKFVPYDQVSQYLMAADIGIIIRDDNIVNRVASPIKFSEYLACGLPVISNDSVALITSTIKTYNCGFILENLDNLSTHKIQELTQIDRVKIAKIGHDLFGIDNVSKNYLQTYKKLI